MLIIIILILTCIDELTYRLKDYRIYKLDNNKIIFCKYINDTRMPYYDYKKYGLLLDILHGLFDGVINGLVILFIISCVLYFAKQ